MMSILFVYFVNLTTTFFFSSVCFCILVAEILSTVGTTSLSFWLQKSLTTDVQFSVGVAKQWKKKRSILSGAERICEDFVVWGA